MAMLSSAIRSLDDMKLNPSGFGKELWMGPAGHPRPTANPREYSKSIQVDITLRQPAIATAHRIQHHTGTEWGKAIQSQPVEYTIKFLTLKKFSRKTSLKP